jgi:ATP-binding cassette, subfamily B, bacterial
LQTCCWLGKTPFKAAAEHDLSFYDEYSSGRIQSRITSDTREFGNLVVLTTDLVSQVVESSSWRLCWCALSRGWSLYLFGMIPVIFIMAISYRTWRAR